MDPRLSENLKIEVLKRNDLTPIQVRNELKPMFGPVVSLGLIKQIREGTERSVNIEKAKTEASRNLDSNNELTTKVQGALETEFFSEALTLREKLEVSKELRAWTKLGIDQAGILDKDGDVLFLISEWSTGE